MKTEGRNIAVSLIPPLLLLLLLSPIVHCTHARPRLPSINPGGGVEVCPINALKLGACADVLNGLVHVVIGDPSRNKCCAVLGGLLELEAALCLCTALKANVLGLHVDIPIALNLLIACGRHVPNGFVCE